MQVGWVLSIKTLQWNIRAVSLYILSTSEENYWQEQKQIDKHLYSSFSYLKGKENCGIPFKQTESS